MQTRTQHESLAQAHRDAMIREQIIRDPDAARHAIECMSGVAGAAAQQGRRRASAASFTPADITGIAHWWRGTDVVDDGTDIVSWTNLISGRPAQTQSTPSKRTAYSVSTPTLGQPGGIALAADKAEYRATYATSISQPFSVVVAFSFDSLPGTYSSLIGGAGGAAGGGSWFFRREGAALQLFAGGAPVNTTGHTNAIDTAYTAIAVLNGASSKIRINGVSRYAGATNIGAAATGDAYLMSEAFINGFDGEFCEAMIISGDVTTGGQLADLESYLSARYL